MFVSDKEFTSTRHQSILTCQTGSLLYCFEEGGNSFRNSFRPVGLSLLFSYFQLYLCGILKVEQCHFKSPILILLFFIISYMLPSHNCDPLTVGVPSTFAQCPSQRACNLAQRLSQGKIKGKNLRRKSLGWSWYTLLQAAPTIY